MAQYQPLYNDSYALIIGIDEYVYQPPLAAAVRGAAHLAEHLENHLYFNVTLLTDSDVTRDAVFSWLRWAGRNTKPNDRVLIYFSGHGLTRNLGSYERGYLALPNARSDEWHKMLQMDDVTEEAQVIKAKHLVYILDCCFSGLAITKNVKTSDITHELDYYLTRPVRYAITAGGAEVVDDALAP